MTIFMLFIKSYFVTEDGFGYGYHNIFASLFIVGVLESGTAWQSFMILALPLILRYNNQKGRGMKYFFYIFYPAHTFLLFYLANFVF